MAWRRGKGGKEGRLVRVNYGDYDHTGHLNRWQKTWINRKERKARRNEARQERVGHAD